MVQVSLVLGLGLRFCALCAEQGSQGTSESCCLCKAAVLNLFYGWCLRPPASERAVRWLCVILASLHAVSTDAKPVAVCCCCCCCCGRCCCCCRREEKIAGAVAGGYSRDTSALRPEVGVAKRSGDLLSEGFTKPKKFKT